MAKVLEKTDVKPVLKWAGGKRELVPEIREFYKNLSPTKYVEPFFGGGAVYFDILKTLGIQHKETAIINDVNQDLIDMYRNIKSNPKELLYHCNNLKKDYEQHGYYFLREKFNGLDSNKNNIERFEGIERSAALIVINRTCFNGLYRVNSNGFFNVPKGSYKNPRIVDEENLYKLSNLLPKIENIRCQEFDEIKNVNKGDLVYFDPPYYPLNETSSFTAYSSSFGKNEQIRLKEYYKKLNESGVYVILSNSSSPFIKEIYSEFQILKIYAGRNINSKAKKRGKIPEFLILGDSLVSQ